MKTLYIIRHAKSDYPPYTEDHQRPLSGRGRTDAGIVAAHAAEILALPQLAWSSTARRAADTASIFALRWNLPIEYLDPLYTFDVSQLTAVVMSAPDSINTLAVFGHNEAITDFVNKFGDIKIDNVPTSALIAINFNCNSWRDIAGGQTTNVLLPKDLRT